MGEKGVLYLKIPKENQMSKPEYLKEKGKTYTKSPKELGRYNNPVEAEKAGFNKEYFRGASLYEVSGPHYKRILWVNNRPYVVK